MNFKNFLGLSEKPLPKEKIHEIVSAAQIQIERSWWQVVLVVFIFFIVLSKPQKVLEIRPEGFCTH